MQPPIPAKSLEGSEQPNSEAHRIAPSDQAPCTPEQAYDAYFECVWRNLRRLGVPESLVEDAVQDVFLIVHRSWAKFEHRSTLRTWVLGIALRVAKDYRLRRDRAMRQCDYAQEELCSHDSPEENAAQAQAKHLLSILLETLDQDHRSILVFVELEQLSVTEAAHAIGIPVSTAYKRLDKAQVAFEQAFARARARDERRLKCKG